MPSNITRWPNGIADSSETGQHALYAGLRPNRYFEYFDDFNAYVAANWILTETAAGSTELIVAGNNGVLAITNVSAGASDEASIQWCGTAAAVIPQWTFDSTKDFVMNARFKVSDATNTGFVIGLAIADTTPVASLPANGIFFNKVAASTSLLGNLRASAASSTVTLGTLANDTYVQAAFNYSAATGYWQGYLNDVLVGSLTTAPTAPSVALAPTIGLLNATALAHVLSIDYIQLAQQR